MSVWDTNLYTGWDTPEQEELERNAYDHLYAEGINPITVPEDFGQERMIVRDEWPFFTAPDRNGRIYPRELLERRQNAMPPDDLFDMEK